MSDARKQAPLSLAFGRTVGGGSAKPFRPWQWWPELGAPYRFTDPARFSFAHGGKDRHTFPAPLKVYDETIRTLKSAVRKCKARRDEELGALKRLDDQARSLGQHVSGPSVEEMISPEFQTSHAFGGRSAPSLSGVSLLATEADVTKRIDI